MHFRGHSKTVLVVESSDQYRACELFTELMLRWLFFLGSVCGGEFMSMLKLCRDTLLGFSLVFSRLVLQKDWSVAAL